MIICSYEDIQGLFFCACHLATKLGVRDIKIYACQKCPLREANQNLEILVSYVSVNFGSTSLLECLGDACGTPCKINTPSPVLAKNGGHMRVRIDKMMFGFYVNIRRVHYHGSLVSL